MDINFNTGPVRHELLQVADAVAREKSIDRMVVIEAMASGITCLVTDYGAPGDLAADGRGVRIDSHVYAGYTIPSTYDSMIAKLITTGKDRREAIARMSRALGEFMLTGIKTTIPLELAIMRDPNFRRGVYSTNFIERMLSLRQHEAVEKEA